MGFTSHTYNATEGNMIELCIMIFDGILGQGIVLDYLLSIPAIDDPSSPCPINEDVCLGM